MGNRNRIAAIDVGTTKVVAVLAELNSNKKIEILEVVSVKSRGIKRGVVNDVDAAIDVIDEVVQKIRNKSEEDFSLIITGINGNNTRMLQVSKDITLRREVKQTDIEELGNRVLKKSMETNEVLVQMLPLGYRCDDGEAIEDPIDKYTRNLKGNYNIVISRKEDVENLKECFRGADNVKIEELMSGIVASSDAVLTQEEKEQGVLMIDMGGGTTDIAIYLDGVLQHTRVIPFGSNNITRDIKEGFLVLLKEAEQLKVRYGKADVELISNEENADISIPVKAKKEKIVSVKDLAKVIGARLDEIIDNVWHDVKDRSLQHKLKAGIVLTGGGALLQNIDKLVEKRTGLPVRVRGPKTSSDITVSNDVNSPKYATVVGLLLRGIYLAQQDDKREKGEEEKKPVNRIRSLWNKFQKSIIDSGEERYQ